MTSWYPTPMCYAISHPTTRNVCLKNDCSSYVPKPRQTDYATAAVVANYLPSGLQLRSCGAADPAVWCASGTDKHIPRSTWADWTTEPELSTDST